MVYVRRKPLSFRVTADGEWTDEKEEWALKAINAAKNLRSVFDGLFEGTVGYITLDATSENAVTQFTPRAGEIYSGDWPEGE